MLIKKPSPQQYKRHQFSTMKKSLGCSQSMKQIKKNAKVGPSLYEKALFTKANSHYQMQSVVKSESKGASIQKRLMMNLNVRTDQIRNPATQNKRKMFDSFKKIHSKTSREIHEDEVLEKSFLGHQKLNVSHVPGSPLTGIHHAEPSPLISSLKSDFETQSEKRKREAKKIFKNRKVDAQMNTLEIHTPISYSYEEASESSRNLALMEEYKAMVCKQTCTNCQRLKQRGLSTDFCLQH